MDSEFPQLIIENSVGNKVTVPNLLSIRAMTYTSDVVPSSATDVPVDNASDFTSGSILLLLDEMGAENAEIVHSSGSTISDFTTSATLLDHNRGEAVQELQYDQIVIQSATALTGPFSTVATLLFQVKQENTIFFDDDGGIDTWYRLQWRNSISGATSDASEPQNVNAYPANSVASLIIPVLTAMGISPDDPKITTAFCISAINDARLFMEANLYGIRQPWQEVFEFPTKLYAGTNFIPLPANIDYQETDRSVLAVRFLIDNILTPYNLRYIDKRTWNQVAFSVMGSTPVSDIHIGDTDIVLEDSGDFWNVDGGSVAVATTDFDQEIMWLTYASNDKDTNTLHGVSGITRDFPAGTQMWTRPTISQPIYYTVYNDRLVFDRVIPDSMQGFNVYLDYYQLMQPVVNLYDIVPEHYRETYKWYLRFAIKYRKDIALPEDDPDLVRFQALVKAVYDNLYTGQDTSIVTM